MNYDLPKTLEVGGADRAIRWDYRAALDILEALSDPELSGEERSQAALTIFYPDFEELPPELWREAMDKLCRFLDGGEGPPARGSAPRLMDWKQDFPRIVGPVNRILGREIRENTPTHWWTFLSAYAEIGDCLFAQIVAIRYKKARGKRLDKAEQEFYRGNRTLIDLRPRCGGEETRILEEWTVKR